MSQNDARYGLIHDEEYLSSLVRLQNSPAGMEFYVFFFRDPAPRFAYRPYFFKLFSRGDAQGMSPQSTFMGCIFSFSPPRDRKFYVSMSLCSPVSKVLIHELDQVEYLIRAIDPSRLENSDEHLACFYEDDDEPDGNNMVPPNSTVEEETTSTRISAHLDNLQETNENSSIKQTRDLSSDSNFRQHTKNRGKLAKYQTRRDADGDTEDASGPQKTSYSSSNTFINTKEIWLRSDKAHAKSPVPPICPFKNLAASRCPHVGREVFSALFDDTRSVTRHLSLPWLLRRRYRLLSKLSQMKATLHWHHCLFWAGTSLVIVHGFLIRVCVASGSYSGMATPPRFGDYEAQRHWMEITLNTPLREWYVDTPSNPLDYWGLDYPPLSAYFAMLWGYFARFCGFDALVALNSSRGFESPDSKSFMRLTVLLSDFLLFTPAVFSCTWAVLRRYRTASRMAVVTGLFQLPLQIIMDNGHFQYNSVGLSLSLFAIASVLDGRLYFGAFFFTAALLFKQISLYYAIPFFSIMLSMALRQGAADSIGSNSFSHDDLFSERPMSDGLFFSDLPQNLPSPTSFFSIFDRIMRSFAWISSQAERQLFANGQRQNINGDNNHACTSPYNDFIGSKMDDNANLDTNLYGVRTYSKLSIVRQALRVSILKDESIKKAELETLDSTPTKHQLQAAIIQSQNLPTSESSGLGNSPEKPSSASKSAVPSATESSLTTNTSNSQSFSKKIVPPPPLSQSSKSYTSESSVKRASLSSLSSSTTYTSSTSSSFSFPPSSFSSSTSSFPSQSSVRWIKVPAASAYFNPTCRGIWNVIKIGLVVFLTTFFVFLPIFVSAIHGVAERKSNTGAKDGTPKIPSSLSHNTDGYEAVSLNSIINTSDFPLLLPLFAFFTSTITALLRVLRATKDYFLPSEVTLFEAISACRGVLDSVMRRVFPLARGLFEDKVATFWCVSNTLFKWNRYFSNPVLASFSGILTLLASLPSAIDLFIRPTSRRFLASLTTVSLAFFLFSFQVHEKSIMFPALLVQMQMLHQPNLVNAFQTVALFSCFPLIQRDGLGFYYLLFQLARTAAGPLDALRTGNVPFTFSFRPWTLPDFRLTAFFAPIRLYSYQEYNQHNVKRAAILAKQDNISKSKDHNSVNDSEQERQQANQQTEGDQMKYHHPQMRLSKLRQDIPSDVVWISWFIMIILHVLRGIGFQPTRYPYLMDLLFATYSFCFFFYTYVFFLYAQLFVLPSHSRTFSVKLPVLFETDPEKL